MTEAEVRMLWVYARARWANFEISNDERVRAVQLQAWLDELGDLNAGAVRAAMVSLGTSQFFPALGLLRQEALELTRVAHGMSRCPTLDQAWGEVVTAIARGGARSRPQFSHPAIAETVKAMGWSQLCASDNQDVLRGQFARMYELARQRVLKSLNPPPPALERFHAEAAGALGSGEVRE